MSSDPGDDAKPVGRGTTAGRTQPYAATRKAHNPGSAKPIDGRCGAKLRGSKPARYCKDWPIKGKRRCRKHGGKTPAGKDSPNYRHGLRSKYLPKGLLQRYEQARADQQLGSIREDLALTEALLADITVKLKEKRPVTARQRSELVTLMDHRRKLIEAEARRLKDLHQMITIDRYLAQMQVVGQIILKHVKDQPVLDAIHDDLQRHLLKPADQVEEGAEP